MAGLDDVSVAGIYGRQKPFNFSSAKDKRDLAITFGLDKRIQIKDPFFHNANSAFRREVWEKHPFSETVTNIEDRVWGMEVIQAGFKIIYEPEAQVFHFHGIHHDGNEQRANQIANIIDDIDPSFSEASINMADKHILAVLPFRSSGDYGVNKLLKKTTAQLLDCKFIDEVAISSSDCEMDKLAGGDKVQLISRPEELDSPHTDLFTVVQHAVNEYERVNTIPDFVLMCTANYIFRDGNVFDDLVEMIGRTDADVVFSAIRDEGIVVDHDVNSQVLNQQLFRPKIFSEHLKFRALTGLGTIFHADVFKRSDFSTLKFGNILVEEASAALTVNSTQTLAHLEQALRDAQ